MIDLNKEANRAYRTALKRGLPLDHRSIVKHLQSEVKELMNAPAMKNVHDIQRIANTRCDTEFMKEYNSKQKDTVLGEYIDVIVNALTGLSTFHIDIEYALMNTQRANSLRVD